MKRWIPWCLLGVVVAPAVLAVEVAEPAAPAKRPHRASKVELPVAEGERLLRGLDAGRLRVQLDLAEQVLRLHAPQSDSWRTAGELRPGDTVRVGDRGSALLDGAKTLARLPRGALLTVREPKPDWVAVTAPIQGKAVRGWVRAKDVVFEREESPLHAVLPPLHDGATVSASLLTQKAKQFDDGLYAAVELAAQHGAGQFAGKRAMLQSLAEALARLDAGQASPPVQTVLAAARLGGARATLAPVVEQRVTAALRQFQADPLRSKPLAFYGWSDELRAIFQQDRLLQTPLDDAQGLRQVANALAADAAGRKTYEAYLRLVARLTNPLVTPGLENYLASSGGDDAAGPQAVAFFPPSVSHETDLIKRLYGNQPIPEGFSLADELIRRIQSGDLDLTPRPDSGWYDYQTWSLETLVVPERARESARLDLDPTYRKLLLDLFKGALALARETHIKQLEIPPAAEAAPPPVEEKPKVFIHPQLSAEPLATSYQRRALGYRMLRRTLEETFGREALASMHRLTASGPVAMNLAEELAAIESLFTGAYAVVCRQLGLPPETEFAQASARGLDADARHFLDWAANLDHDVDLAQDARMMVPVFYDVQRKKTKVWLLLGWTTRPVEVAFARPPVLSVRDAQGMPLPADAVEAHFHSAWAEVAYPVTAEVYVSNVLDRQEFRRHCDAFQTRSAILENLR